jgi:hypothetical protein
MSVSASLKDRSAAFQVLPVGRYETDRSFVSVRAMSRHTARSLNFPLTGRLYPQKGSHNAIQELTGSSAARLLEIAEGQQR